MIHIDRASVPEPTRFAKRARAAHRELAGLIKDSGSKLNQRKLPFDDRLLEADDLRQSLRQLFKGRCAFCESPLTPSHQLVTHFRPRERAAQLDGKVSPLHYWWLAYDWANLYLSCADCLSAKGKRFPVRGRRTAQPGSGKGSTSDEKALLLDPCRDDPESELEFLEDGTVRSSTERGRVTIDVFGLNRIALVNARRDYCERTDAVGDLFLVDNEPLKWTEPNFLAALFTEVPDDWGYRALITQQARRHLARATTVEQGTDRCVQRVERGASVRGRDLAAPDSN